MISARSRFTVYVYGILGALGTTITLMVFVMRPPLDDLIFLALLLVLTGLVSVVIGLVSHRMGWWQRTPSLRHSIIIGYVLATILTLINVWITAELMFVNAHDLALATLLLIFTGGISVSFGFFLAGSITHTLDGLIDGAIQVSEGDFSTRVAVDGDDEISQLAKTFNMMTERLEQAADEAEALDTARRNLVAWASHDLRTPLASLRAMIEAMDDRIVDDPDTISRYLEQSQTQINRMSSLINDLFELAQLDTGQYTLTFEDSSLSDLISDTLSAFAARAKAKDITLQGTIVAGVDPVWMASDKISRVLYNLLENAIRHTPAGGEISLKAELQDECVVVTVRDTGRGIPQDDLPQVFDHFFRGEKSRQQRDGEGGGSGLGLAIAKGLVEAHGGRIWVDSEVGKGTLLQFMLPRQQRGEPQPLEASTGVLKLLDGKSTAK
jgi:signal transduction histidine kinase